MKRNEVMVLAILAGHENEGIGKALLDLLSEALFDTGHDQIWLAASATPVVRAFGFYRHIGWQPSHCLDENGDEIMTLNRPI